MPEIAWVWVWHMYQHLLPFRYDGETITVTPLRKRRSLSELLKEYAADPIDDDWGNDPADLPEPKRIVL